MANGRCFHQSSLCNEAIRTALEDGVQRAPESVNMQRSWVEGMGALCSTPRPCLVHIFHLEEAISSKHPTQGVCVHAHHGAGGWRGRAEAIDPGLTDTSDEGGEGCFRGTRRRGRIRIRQAQLLPVTQWDTPRCCPLGSGRDTGGHVAWGRPHEVCGRSWAQEG